MFRNKFLPRTHFIRKSYHRTSPRHSSFLLCERRLLVPFINYRTQRNIFGNMSVTELMWKSLDNYSKSWSYLWTSPIEWDHKKKILVYNGVSLKLIPWAIALYLISSPLLIILVLLVLSPLLGYNNILLPDYIIAFHFCSLAIIFYVGETFQLLLGKDTVHAANSLISLYTSWTKSKAFLSKNKRNTSLFQTFLFQVTSFQAIPGN